MGLFLTGLAVGILITVEVALILGMRVIARERKKNKIANGRLEAALVELELRMNNLKNRGGDMKDREVFS